LTSVTEDIAADERDCNSLLHDSDIDRSDFGMKDDVDGRCRNRWDDKASDSRDIRYIRRSAVASFRRGSVCWLVLLIVGVAVCHLVIHRIGAA